MFVGDFNSKLEAFGYAKKNHIWSDAQKYSKSIKFNLYTDEHMHLDKRTGNTNILDMAFISQNLSKHDIQFLIGDDARGEFVTGDSAHQHQYIIVGVNTPSSTR